QRDQCAAVRAGAGGGGAVHGRNGNRERTAAPHPGEVVPGDESGAALRPGAEAEVRPLLRCRAAPGADRLGIVIEIRDLTKSYGRTAALDRLSFTAEPGRVTGFLGPNGAGKSTTLRLLLGLDRPDSGSALVFGGRYAGLRYPLRRVGSLIDADAVDGARRAGDHLRWLARSNRIGAHRVTEVLDLVGLGVAAAARSATVSIALLAALWYVVPMTTRFLPEPWGERAGSVLPGGLAAQIAASGSGSVYGDLLTPAGAAAAMAAWALLPLLAALPSLRRGVLDRRARNGARSRTDLAG